MATKADWREIGFDQGVAAGTADMDAVYRFASHEKNLALGHAVLEGKYALVTQKYLDFPDHDCCAAWMAGVIEGSSSVGARMGYSTGTPDLASGVDGAMRLHLMIVRDAWPAGDLSRTGTASATTQAGLDIFGKPGPVDQLPLNEDARDLAHLRLRAALADIGGSFGEMPEEESRSILRVLETRVSAPG